MGILDDLSPKHTNAARLNEWLASRPADEQAEWNTALKDQAKYSTGAIVRALKARGFEISINALYHYRSKLS